VGLGALQISGQASAGFLVDLPFALPTAVAGIALTAIYSSHGWIGHHLEPLGIKAAYSRLGVVIALTFTGLPFVVRTVQPVLEDLDQEMEEAAASLGAGRWQTISRVLFPAVMPAALTGFAMAFARAVASMARSSSSQETCRCEPKSPPSHHYQAGTIRLRRCDRDCRGHAGCVVRLVADDQSPAGVERQTGKDRRLARSPGGDPDEGLGVPERQPGRKTTRNESMATTVTLRNPAAVSPKTTTATTEGPWVRWLLTGIAVLFLGVFLFLPLAVVFSSALAKGLAAYLASLREPDAWAAIRLTLIAAGIAVPANLLFGVAAAWAIGKFDFFGKSVLITLIDLPFAVSPVVSGLVYVLLFGSRDFWVRGGRSRHQDHFAVPGIVLARSL